MEIKYPIRHIRTNIVKPRKYSKWINDEWIKCYQEYLKKYLKKKS